MLFDVTEQSITTYIMENTLLPHFVLHVGPTSLTYALKIIAYQRRKYPSRHTTLIQRRLNVDATS